MGHGSLSYVRCTHVLLGSDRHVEAPMLTGLQANCPTPPGFAPRKQVPKDSGQLFVRRQEQDITITWSASQLAPVVGCANRTEFGGFCCRRTAYRPITAAPSRTTSWYKSRSKAAFHKGKCQPCMQAKPSWKPAEGRRGRRPFCSFVLQLHCSARLQKDLQSTLAIQSMSHNSALPHSS